MTRTVAYIRVSTAKQADHGVSLDAQRAKVNAYASLYDLHLVDVVVDAGASAKTLNRDGLDRALAMLDNGEAEALLVVKLDRLTRSVRDLDTLIQQYFASNNGPALLSVGENIDTRSAAGRLVLNVLASVSQWEREATGERTRTAMAQMKAEGKRVGAVPYGFDLAEDGAMLVENEAEQAVVALAKEYRAKGYSLRSIAAELAAHGFRSRTGRVFAATQISRLCAA